MQLYFEIRISCTCFNGAFYLDAGNLAGSSEMYDGQLEIPNLSEENDPEDIDVSRTLFSFLVYRTS